MKETMKFAYSTSLFRFHPLSEALESIADAGFRGVELMADRPHAFPKDFTASQITDLIECMARRRLRVCNLNSAVVTSLGDSQGPSWTDRDMQKRDKRVQYTMECLRLATALGIPSVSTEPGGSPVPEMAARLGTWELLAANIRRVLPLAEKLGVPLLIQPEPGTLLASSDDIKMFLKDLGYAGYLKVNFDAGHFFCAGENPCDSYEKLREYVAHVHLEDIPANRGHRHIQLGEGVMDISGFLQCLKESGYDGYVTIKLDAYDRRAEEMVAASAHYLEEKGFSVGDAG